MNEQLLVYILFLAGAVARPALLYLREWLDSGTAFDWRFLIGQVVGVAVLLVPMIAWWAEQLAGATPYLALALGWAAADLGREAQKSFWR